MSWKDLGISDPGPLPTGPVGPARAPKAAPKVRLLPSRPAPAVQIAEPPAPVEHPAVKAAEGLAVALERLAVAHGEALAEMRRHVLRARLVAVAAVLLGVLIAVLF